MSVVVNLDGVTLVVAEMEGRWPTTAEDRTPSAVPERNGRRGEHSE